RYLTAFKVPYEYVIDAAARRQKWIDQAQSVNLFLGDPDMKTLSHMYRRAWRVGLKTTYYLRSLGASNIEKATVAVKKEVRGAVAGAEASSEAPREGGSEAAPAKKVYSEAEKKACSIEAMRRGEECEACQ
ncbi:MAG: ribonucleoside-diphosphate reductase subunit alpha, partial [Opitutaceae bacterium]|nr:ribonucleoside-diphosphate reductase subunit alpha [Opitutaceae bacterium]